MPRPARHWAGSVSRTMSPRSRYSWRRTSQAGSAASASKAQAVTRKSLRSNAGDAREVECLLRTLASLRFHQFKIAGIDLLDPALLPGRKQKRDARRGVQPGE